MKGVTSDVAARVIRNSCREKFPVKIQNDEEIPESAAQKLAGKGNATSYGWFEGTIYNGNSEWTLTALEIRISDNKTGVFRDYKTQVDISPIETGKFSFKVFEIPEDRSWGILRAYGHK
jgi:hypothetical protein